MQEELREEGAIIYHKQQRIVSKELPVFYNPVMKHNRDISALVIAQEERPLQCCDLLAGSGVRSIRLLQETNNIKHLTINDYDNTTFSQLQENLTKNICSFTIWSLNDFSDDTRPTIVVSNLDANMLLLASSGYDYIDIDPFGSPNTFLDAACKRISRKGILAITMTDTSAPAGSYPQACQRKYWAQPTKGIRKHEVGLRIMIRKIQLVAAQYDKALEPILCYNKDHYYRLYFRVRKGKTKVDSIIQQHGRWDQEPTSGPLWLGKMASPEFIDRLIAISQDDMICDWLSIIKQENELRQPGYLYHLNELQQLIPIKKEALLKQLPLVVSASHYEGNVIKSELDIEEITRKLAL